MNSREVRRQTCDEECKICKLKAKFFFLVKYLEINRDRGPRILGFQRGKLESVP